MTREEQIVEAGKTAAEGKEFSVLVNKQRRTMSAYEIGFIEGAEWADSHPQWIPVEERKPQENQRVRVWSLENNEEYLCDYHDGIFEDFYGSFTDGVITHWMEIVPPVKKGGNDENN